VSVAAAPGGRAVRANVHSQVKDAARARSTCFQLADMEATIVSTSLRNARRQVPYLACEPFTTIRLAHHLHRHNNHISWPP
jgi:hypothetical protein